jgi:hypothetical protein
LKEDNKICNDKNLPAKKDLVQGEDYYINEKGNWVFTEKYHLQRGYCCKSDCKHYPYGYYKNEK